MAPMLDALERETGGPVVASIVWLHGLGADGHDFRELPELLGLGPGVRCVLPHAPVRPVTLNGGMVMRAWFDILGLAPEAPEDETGIRAAEAEVRALLERERARGSRAVLLGGFSQGGALALHTALRMATPLAGVAALSCWLPLAAQAPAEATEAGRSTPVWMAHGLGDEIVRLEWGQRACERLRALGCEVEWRTWPMGHVVSLEELQALGGWVRARLGL